MFFTVGCSQIWFGGFGGVGSGVGGIDSGSGLGLEGGYGPG